MTDRPTPLPSLPKSIRSTSSRISTPHVISLFNPGFIISVVEPIQGQSSDWLVVDGRRRIFVRIRRGIKPLSHFL
ncbi:hypothetical protein HYQ46_010366 [Verticillium longisporum]|nr:hypothetical protein HYQ46_010366 [Verticillium longisporum]